MDDKPTLIPKSYLDKMVKSVFSEQGGPIRRPTGAHITATNYTTLTPGEVEAVQDVFLSTFAGGLSETAARKEAGVSATVLDEWKKDEEFLRKFDTAFDEGTDYLEDMAFIKAHQSDQVLIKLLEARRPDRFKPNRGGGAGAVKVVINQLFNEDTPQQQITVESDGD